MSLHHLARQVQSQGRDEDKMLVHMTPGEVKGLQSLAVAHGGSLSINPDTGLVEAFSLKSILPTVIGAGLAATGVGMPFAIAAGAGTGLLTSGGNLRAGIMGGLGAWGGASLATSLMGAGAGALAPEAIAGGLGVQGAATGAGSQAGMLAAQNAGFGTAGIESIRGAAAGASGFSPAAVTGMPTAGATIQEGFKQAAANPGQFFNKNMFQIGAAAAPALFDNSGQQNAIGSPPGPGQIRPFTYNQTRNPDFGKVPGAAYFDQSYTAGTPYAAANGGLMSLAEGGDVNKTPAVDMLQLAPASTKYGAQRPVNPAVTDFNKLIMDRAANEYITQPAPLATLPGRGERANVDDTRKIINEYYLSSLGRQGEQAGLDFHAQQKMNTGATLGEIKGNISGSPEGQVFSAYKDLLGRRPDAGGAESFQNLLASGMSNQDMRNAIMGSQEYLSRPAAAQPTTEQAAQTGFTFDPVTKRFSGGLPTPAAMDAGGFMGMDPNVLQQMYSQFQQQQQSSSGGKAGGLMPNALKYNMGGGISDLGGYSDGGRLLKGPGDGVSDSIPAQIGAKQPARLADGEFVIPARIVSELGNGSTDAGARRLYAMMDRVQKKRGKTVGKNKVAVNSKAESTLPV